MLTEDLKALRARYPEISDFDFWELIKYDPTYREDSDSAGNYTKWILDKFKANKINDSDLDNNKLVNALKEFDKRKKFFNNQDIYQFKSADELYDRLEKPDDKEPTDRQRERQMRNSYSSKDVLPLLETEHFQSYIPLTYEGSCTLGKGTRWCTADSDESAYFCQYASDGPLVVIIRKDNPKEKYQYHEMTDSFMDSEDKEIESYPEPAEEVRQIVRKADSNEIKELYYDKTLKRESVYKSESFEFVRAKDLRDNERLELVIGNQRLRINFNYDFLPTIIKLYKNDSTVFVKCLKESIISVIKNLCSDEENYSIRAGLERLRDFFDLIQVELDVDNK